LTPVPGGRHIPRIASFVLVHGGWGGGWEWRDVARALRERGNDVWTPTLTGMGERGHLGGPAIGVETHVADLIAVLEHEDLDDVVLCGHSYGGIPATGAADRQPGRIRRLVYIDALVPRDGESAFNLLPAGFAGIARASAVEHGGGWRVPIPAELHPPSGWVAEEVRQRYVVRLGGQPLATFADPVSLTGAVEGLPRAFVRCTAGNLAESVSVDPIAPMAARARREGWTYREVIASHDPQLTHPLETAAVLHELGRS
jgi:pimeloyl-ACP methyl ester carboxylesterase